MRCLICHKPLTAPESLALGIGPDCRARYAAFVAACGSSVERIEALALIGNAEVNRWLHFAQKAIGAGRRGDAREFLAAAEKAVPAPIAAPVIVSAIEFDGLTGRSVRAVYCDGWSI